MPTIQESPPPLSGGFLSVADLPGRFCLAMTRGRCEKALAVGLLNGVVADPFRDPDPNDPNAVHYYLPLAEQVNYEGKRGRYVCERPLFPNYLFCSGHPDYVAARVREIGHRRGHLVSVSEVPERAQAKLRADLLNIETALRICPRLESCGHVVLGGRYRVKAGPLMGVEGKAIQRGKATLFVLEVEIIGRQVPMEIDGDLLEAAA